MSNSLRILRLLPKTSIPFIGIAVFILALSIIQVNCPICSSVAVNSSVDSLVNLKVLEVNGKIIDYKIEHEWCVYSYSTLKYKVDISIVNEGSDPLSASLLIIGTISKEKMEKASVKALVVENAKVIHVEIASKETKQIQEILYIKIFGLRYPERFGLPEIVFSIITDPEELMINCPVCDGTGKVPIIDWFRIKANVQ